MGVILLVKHAQVAPEGPAPAPAADSSAPLTPLGRHQGQNLGAAMSAGAVDPDIVASGTGASHRQTIDAMTGGQPVDVLADDGWDDYDHLDVLARLEPDFGDREPTRAEFQHFTERACRRWASGRHDADYAETFTDFTQRVARAKLALVSRMAPDATAVVITAGGPIAWIATALWAGWGPEQRSTPYAESWSRANAVVVSSSVTKVALTPHGLSLVSFNDHAHLERTGRTFG